MLLDNSLEYNLKCIGTLTSMKVNLHMIYMYVNMWCIKTVLVSNDILFLLQTYVKKGEVTR